MPISDDLRSQRLYHGTRANLKPGDLIEPHHPPDVGEFTVPVAPGNDYGTGGYENPAPGNDGTPDCAPGQGPVYVGSNDPYGLDRDGDGWGCE